MKKRVKLLTTIASLCLAVALMAFGVYAAYDATLTVNGTFSFKTDKVSGSWAVTGATSTIGEATYTTDSVTLSLTESSTGAASGATAVVTVEVTYTPEATSSNTAYLSMSGSGCDWATTDEKSKTATTSPVTFTFTVSYTITSIYASQADATWVANFAASNTNPNT